MFLQNMTVQLKVFDVLFFLFKGNVFVIDI